VSERAPGKAGPFSAPVIIFIISVSFALVTAFMWMGKTGELSDLEESVEFLNYTCTVDPHGNWEIVFFLSNSGDAPVALTNVYVGSMEVSLYGADGPSSTVSSITTDLVKRGEVPTGGGARVTVWIGAKFGFLTSGSMVKIQILSLGGLRLEKNIMLA
jgi:hypothetical protein